MKCLLPQAFVAVQLLTEFCVLWHFSSLHIREPWCHYSSVICALPPVRLERILNHYSVVDCTLRDSGLRFRVEGQGSQLTIRPDFGSMELILLLLWSLALSVSQFTYSNSCMFKSLGLPLDP